MATALVQSIAPGVPDASYLLDQLHWYAAYTSARHEKKVAAQLEERTVECFLPLYETVRRWKNMRARVQLPLFPGYVFVRMPLRDRLKVLQLPGVVRLVGFNGLPQSLPDDDIEKLRTGLGQRLRAEPHPYLTAGRRVRIAGGPLAGFSGIIVRRKGSLRVVISLDLLTRSVAVDVDSADLEAATSMPGRAIG